jgi:CHAD domain-containing protein/CYTH domain-containing protein
MHDPATLLTADAPEGARLLALDGLEQLRAARALLDATPDDPEAVHDVRVALTRLRAVLRAHHDLFDGALRRRDRRALRRANRALGPIRDRDVQVALLQQFATPELDGEVRAALEWLARRLQVQRTRRLPGALRQLARHLDPHLDRWQESLSHYAVHRVVGTPAPTRPLATVVTEHLGRAMARAAGSAQGATAALGTPAEPDALHRLRVDVKRLRALLLPWRVAVAEVAALFELATRAQDAIGAERDARALATRVRRASLVEPALAVPLHTLADTIEARRVTLAEAVQRVWLHGDAIAELAALVPTVADALTRTLRTDVEIERKFLLHTLPDVASRTPGIRIAQGWLPGERLRERLRRSVYADGRVEWTRTVKLGTGVRRVEIEEPTDPMLFESMWPLTAAARVEKVRHAVPDGALTWEIDVFLDRHLLLAEVELPSEDAEVQLPEWLAPCVEREVTGDPAYVNANLARVPRPTSPA